MDQSKLKTYAQQARRDFITEVTDRAAFYGLTAKGIRPVVEHGDVVLIGERAFPLEVAAKRKRLEERVKRLNGHLLSFSRNEGPSALGHRRTDASSFVA